MILKQSPQYVKRMQLADAMQRTGSDSSPVGHPLEVGSRLANALAGKKVAADAQKAEDTRRYKAATTAFDSFDGLDLSDTQRGRMDLARSMMENPDTMDFGLQMGAQVAMAEPKERKIASDAMGRNRYVDTGDFVFNDMAGYDKNMLSPEAEAQKSRIASAGRTTVSNTFSPGKNYPGLSKLGEGMTYAYNPDGSVKVDERGVPVAVPIQGTRPAIEAEKVAEAARKKQEMTARNGGVVIEDIDRALNIIQNDGMISSTGLIGAAMKNIPGTDAFSLNNLLQTVKANAGFDRLQQMRDASPTGGALGQVSERELTYLQAAIGNLEQAQDDEELIYNLDRVRRIYQDIIHGPAGSPNQQGVDVSDNDPLGLFR